jgi:hypothetical protein
MATTLELVLDLMLLMIIVALQRRTPRNANPTRFPNHHPVNIERLRRSRQQGNLPIIRVYWLLLTTTVHQQDMQTIQQLLEDNLVEVAEGLDVDAVVWD